MLAGLIHQLLEEGTEPVDIGSAERSPEGAEHGAPFRVCESALGAHRGHGGLRGVYWRNFGGGPEDGAAGRREALRNSGGLMRLRYKGNALCHEDRGMGRAMTGNGWCASSSNESGAPIHRRTSS